MGETRDIPIIFSGPMVRALLEGRKTMTRRLAWRDPQPDPADYPDILKIPSPWQKVRPGDRLWVRESLTHVTSDPVTAQPCSVHCYTASIPPGMTSANPYEANYLFPDDGTPALKPKNLPAIHMPRWASRITLTVTAVKIERLKSISTAEAMFEGVERNPVQAGTWMDYPAGTSAAGWSSPVLSFASLWSSLHGADSWDANPEVVALTFTLAPSPSEGGAA